MAEPLPAPAEPATTPEPIPPFNPDNSVVDYAKRNDEHPEIEDR